MSQVKKMLKSPRIRGTLALVIIGIFVVLSIFLPKEPDPNIGLTTDTVTPTVGVTNPVATLMVNRSVEFRDVRLTVMKVEEASAFSDDRKPAGAYTIRVYVHMQPNDTLQSPYNIDYASFVHLILPDGQVVSPKLISLLPVVLPKQPKDGFFDFPAATRVPLSLLTLRFGSNISVVFSG